MPLSRTSILFGDRGPVEAGHMPEVGEVAELGATGTPESHLESDSVIAQPTEVEGPFANQRGCTHPYDSWRSGAHRSGMGDKAETPAVGSFCTVQAARESLCVCAHMYVWEHVYVHPCVWSKEISVDVSLITLYFVLKCVCVFPCMHAPWCTCGDPWTVCGS